MSQQEITKDTVKQKLFATYDKLLDIVSEHEHQLNEAQEQLADFKQALKNGEAECAAFGCVYSRWADNRYLPNGEAITIDQGEETTVYPDSIASDLLKLEADGVSAEDILEEFQEEQEERRCAQREHDHHEEDFGDY
jgi:hypothetical protein